MPKTIKNILIDCVLKMSVPRHIVAAQMLELAVGMLARAHGAEAIATTLRGTADALEAGHLEIDADRHQYSHGRRADAAHGALTEPPR